VLITLVMPAAAVATYVPPLSLPSAYTIGDIVGAGGMGVVYEATHRATPAPIVVKVLRSELSTDPAVRSRFAAEVRALRRLDHPNIARHVDSGDDFLVMERVAGTSLGSVISTSAPLSLARVLAIGDQLLHALAHAHARGVIHADVKSDNLLVDTSTGSDHVVLIDFGVARIVDDVIAVKDPMMSGTPEYMAPEVIRGEQPSVAADLYAVGVILYELLTGTTPFGGGTADAILVRHLEEDAVPPSLRCPGSAITPALERIVMRALAKEPDHRFTSAGTFAVALRDAARGMREVEELATAEAPRTAFSTEAPTRDWSTDEVPEAIRPHRFSRGTRPARNERTQRARATIGDAIIRGDVCGIAAGYLELARVLVNERRLADAVTELEEGIDVLTTSTPTGREPALPLWPMLLTLAAVLDGLGDRRRACAVGRLARDDAARAGSSLGISRAAILLARLDPPHPVISAQRSAACSRA